MDAPRKPDIPTAPPTVPPNVVPKPKSEHIVTIPESYYGVALGMEPPFYTDEDASLSPPVVPPPPAPVVPPAAPSSLPPSLPAEPHGHWMIPAIVILVVLLAGGGWVAWNREAIFGKGEKRQPPKQAAVAPNSATDLAATSTAPGIVRLEWVDRSESEAGYRIERKGSLDIEFVSVQTLPANSRTFLDPSAIPESRASYRVVAFNEGGEAPSASVEVLVQARPVQSVVAAPSLPPDGLDLDSDGLTDTEEILFTSNPQLPDTDADGYLDANEVFNLYAPTVKAPAALLTQSTMQAVSSTIGWQIVAPRAWTVEPVKNDGSTILRVPSGEVFAVRVQPNPSKQAIRAWIMAARGWQDDQILELRSNKYGLSFYMGPDRLTAFIPWEGQVVVVSYELGTQVFVNYRTTFGMMINSLRFEGSPKTPDLSRSVEIPPVFKPEPTPLSSVATSTATISSVGTSTAATTPIATTTNVSLP